MHQIKKHMYRYTLRLSAKERAQLRQKMLYWTPPEGVRYSFGAFIRQELGLPSMPERRRRKRRKPLKKLYSATQKETKKQE